MKTVQIFSDYEFLVEIQNQNYFLDSNNHIQILSPTYPLILKVYPVNQNSNSISYCIKLDNSNITNKNVKVYNFKDRTEIFLLPFTVPSFIVNYTNSHTVKNTKYKISCYFDRINISSTKGDYCYETPIICAQSSISGDYINILCEHNNQKTLVCFNTLNNVFFEIKGEQIEIDNNQIKSLQYLNDSIGHVKLLTYKICDDIKLESQELYLVNQKANISKNKNLIPYNFFECIKCKNFDLARSMLSNSLSNSISDEQLEGYFKNFEKIKLKSLSPLVYTLYTYNEATDYIITLDNDKISEIDNL